MARTRGSSERHRCRRRGHRRLRGRLRAGAARRIGRRSSTIVRPAWVRRRRRPACSRRTSRRTKATRCSSSPFAASICTTSSSRGVAAAAAASPSAYRRTGTLEVALDADGLRRLETLAACAAAEGRARAAARCRRRAQRGAAPVRSGRRRAAGAVAWICRGRRSDARAHRRGSPPRRPVDRARTRPPDRQRRRRSACRDRSRVAVGQRRRARRRQLVGADRHRRRGRPAARSVRSGASSCSSRGPARRSHASIWSDRCYLVPWDDGTLLVGATVEDAGFDERTTTAGIRDLIEAAARDRAAAPGRRGSPRRGPDCGRRRRTKFRSSVRPPSCRISSMRPATIATASSSRR